MKLLLFIVGCFFYTGSSAQRFKVDVPKIMKQSDVLKQFNGNAFQKKIHKDSLMEKFPAPVIGKRVNSGIYRLPQDNMPCLVPDTKDIAAIPNAWPDVRVPFKSGIPNPGLQNKPLIDQQKTTTK